MKKKIHYYLVSFFIYTVSFILFIDNIDVNDNVDNNDEIEVILLIDL